MSPTYRERNWSAKRRLRALRENADFRPGHTTYGGLRYTMFKIAHGKKSVKNARLLSYHLHSYIVQPSSGEKRREPFLKRVHRKIIFVHCFCCKVAEETNVYVLDHYLKDALVAYITLELDVLRDQGLIGRNEHQLALIKRVKTILTGIYSKYQFYLTGKYNIVDIYEMIWKFLISEPLNLPDFFGDILKQIKAQLPPKPKNPDLPYFSINDTKPKDTFADPLYASCGPQNTEGKVIDLTDEVQAADVDAESEEEIEPDPDFDPSVCKQLKYLRKFFPSTIPPRTRIKEKVDTEICASDSEDEVDSSPKHTRLKVYKPPKTIDLTEEPEPPLTFTEVGIIPKNPLMCERVQSLLTELQQIAGTSNMVINVRDGGVEIDTRRRLDNTEPARKAIEFSYDTEKEKENTPTAEQNQVQIESDPIESVTPNIDVISDISLVKTEHKRLTDDSSVAIIELSDTEEDIENSQTFPAIKFGQKFTHNDKEIEDAPQINEIGDLEIAPSSSPFGYTGEITNNDKAIEDAPQINEKEASAKENVEISQSLTAIEFTNNDKGIEDAPQINEMGASAEENVETSRSLPAIEDIREMTKNVEAIEDATQMEPSEKENLEIPQDSPKIIEPSEEISNNDTAMEVEQNTKNLPAIVPEEDIINESTEDSTKLKPEDDLVTEMEPSAEENIEISQSKVVVHEEITNIDNAEENSQIKPDSNKSIESEDDLLGEIEYIGSYEEVDEDLLIGEDENGEKSQAKAITPDTLMEEIDKFVMDSSTSEKTQQQSGPAEASESENKLTLEEKPCDNQNLIKLGSREDRNKVEPPSEITCDKDEKISAINVTSGEDLLTSEDSENLLPDTQLLPETVQSNVTDADVLDFKETCFQQAKESSGEVVSTQQANEEVDQNGKLSDPQVLDTDKEVSVLQQDSSEMPGKEQIIGNVQEASNVTNIEVGSLLIVDREPEIDQKASDIGSSQPSQIFGAEKSLDTNSDSDLVAENILKQCTTENSPDEQVGDSLPTDFSTEGELPEKSLEVLPEQPSALLEDSNIEAKLEDTLLADSNIEAASTAETLLEVLQKEVSEDALLADSVAEAEQKDEVEKTIEVPQSALLAEIECESKPEVLPEQPSELVADSSIEAKLESSPFSEDASLADSNIEVVSIAEKPSEVLPKQVVGSVAEAQQEHPREVLQGQLPFADSAAEAEREYIQEKPLEAPPNQPAVSNIEVKLESIAEKPLEVLPKQFAEEQQKYQVECSIEILKGQLTQDALLADSVAEKPAQVLPDEPQEEPLIADSVAEKCNLEKHLEVLPEQPSPLLADSNIGEKLETIAEKSLPQQLADSVAEAQQENKVENPIEVLPGQLLQDALPADSVADAERKNKSEIPVQDLSEQSLEDASHTDSVAKAQQEYKPEKPLEVLPEQPADSNIEVELKPLAEEPLKILPKQLADSMAEAHQENKVQNPIEVLSEQLSQDDVSEAERQNKSENPVQDLPEQSPEDASHTDSVAEAQQKCILENPIEVLPEQLPQDTVAEAERQYEPEKPVQVLPEETLLADSVPEVKLEYKPLEVLPERPSDDADTDAVIEAKLEHPIEPLPPVEDSVVEVEVEYAAVESTEVQAGASTIEVKLSIEQSSDTNVGPLEVSIENSSEQPPEAEVHLENPPEKIFELQTQENKSEVSPIQKVDPIEQSPNRLEASQDIFVDTISTTPKHSPCINILSNLVVKKSPYSIHKTKQQTESTQEDNIVTKDVPSRRKARKGKAPSTCHITGESPQTIELFSKYIPKRKIDFTQEPLIEELNPHSEDAGASTKLNSEKLIVQDSFEETFPVELKQEESSNNQQQITLPCIVHQQNTVLVDVPKEASLIKMEKKKLHRHSIENLLSLDEKVVDPAQFDSNIPHTVVSDTQSIPDQMPPKEEALDLKKPESSKTSHLPPRRLSRKTSSSLSLDVLRNLPQDKISTYYPDFSLHSRQLSDESNNEALNLSHSKEDYSKDALNLTTDKNNFKQFLDPTQTETIVLVPEEQITPAPIEQINWQIETIPLNVHIPSDSYHVTPNLMEPTKVPAAYMQSPQNSHSNNLLQLADVALQDMYLTTVPDVPPQGNSESPVSTDSEGKLEIELPPEILVVAEASKSTSKIRSDPQVLKRPKTKAELKGVPEDSGNYSDDEVSLADRLKRDDVLVAEKLKIKRQAKSAMIIKRKPGRPGRVSNVETKSTKKVTRKKKAKKDPLPYTAKLRSRSLSSSEPEKIKEEPIIIASPKPRSRKSSAASAKEPGKITKVASSTESLVAAVVEKKEDLSLLEPVITEAAPKTAEIVPKTAEAVPKTAETIPKSTEAVPQTAEAVPKTLEIPPKTLDAILPTSPPFKKRFNFLKKYNPILERTIAKVSVEVQRHHQINQTHDFKVENTISGQCKIESGNEETLKMAGRTRSESMFEDVPLTQLKDSKGEEKLVSSSEAASIVVPKEEPQITEKESKNEEISSMSKEESQTSFLAKIELEKKVSDSETNVPTSKEKQISNKKSREEASILPSTTVIKKIRKDKTRGRRKRRNSKRASDGLMKKPLVTQESLLDPKQEDTLTPTPDNSQTPQAPQKRRSSTRASENLVKKNLTEVEKPTLEPKLEDTVATELDNSETPQPPQKRRSSLRSSDTVDKSLTEVEEPAFVSTPAKEDILEPVEDIEVPKKKSRGFQKRRASTRASDSLLKKPLAHSGPILTPTSIKEDVLEASTLKDVDNTEISKSPQKRRASIRASEILLKKSFEHLDEDILGALLSTDVNISEIEKKKSQSPQKRRASTRASEGLLKKPLAEEEEANIVLTPKIEDTLATAAAGIQATSTPQKRRSSVRASEVRDLVKTNDDLSVRQTIEPVSTETFKEEESSRQIKEANLSLIKPAKASPSMENTCVLQLSKKAAAPLHKPRRGRPPKRKEPAVIVSSNCEPEDNKEKFVAQELSDVKATIAGVSKVPENTEELTKIKLEDTKSSVEEKIADKCEKELVVAEKPSATETITKVAKNKTEKSKKSSATEIIAEVAASENISVAEKLSVTDTKIDEVIENKSKISDISVADLSSVAETIDKVAKNKCKKSSTSEKTPIIAGPSSATEPITKVEKLSEPSVKSGSKTTIAEATKGAKNKSKKSTASEKTPITEKSIIVVDIIAETSKSKSKKLAALEKAPIAEKLTIAAMSKNKSKKSSESETTPTAEKLNVAENESDKLSSPEEPLLTEKSSIVASKTTAIAEKSTVIETIAGGAENKPVTEKPSVVEKSSVSAEVPENKSKKSSVSEKTSIAEKSNITETIAEVAKSNSKKSSASAKTSISEKSNVAETSSEVETNKSKKSAESAEKSTVIESVPEVALNKPNKSNESEKAAIAEKLSVVDSISKVTAETAKKTGESAKKSTVPVLIPKVATTKTKESEKTSIAEKSTPEIGKNKSKIASGKTSISADSIPEVTSNNSKKSVKSKMTSVTKKSFVAESVSNKSKQSDGESEETPIAEISAAPEIIPVITSSDSKKSAESKKTSTAKKSDSTSEMTTNKSKNFSESEKSTVAEQSSVDAPNSEANVPKKSDKTPMAKISNVAVTIPKVATNKSKKSGESDTAEKSTNAESIPEVGKNKSKKFSESEKTLIAAAEIIPEVTSNKFKKSAESNKKTSTAKKSICSESIPELTANKSKESESEKKPIAKKSSVAETTPELSSTKSGASEKTPIAEKLTVTELKIPKVTTKKSKKSGESEKTQIAENSTPEVGKNESKSEKTPIAEMATLAEPIPKVSTSKSKQSSGESEKTAIADKLGFIESNLEVAPDKSKKRGVSEKTPISKQSTVAASVPEVTADKSKQSGESEKIPNPEKSSKLSEPEKTPIAEKPRVAESEVASSESKKSGESEKILSAKKSIVNESKVVTSKSKKSLESEKNSTAEKVISGVTTSKSSKSNESEKKTTVTESVAEVTKNKSKKSVDSENIPIDKKSTSTESSTDKSNKSGESEKTLTIQKSSAANIIDQVSEGTSIAEKSRVTENKPKDTLVSESKSSAIEISKDVTKISAKIVTATGTEKDSESKLATKKPTEDGSDSKIKDIPEKTISETVSKIPEKSNVAVATKASELESTKTVAKGSKKPSASEDKEKTDIGSESHATELWDLECENEIEVQSTVYESAYGLLCESIKHDDEELAKKQDKTKIEPKADNKKVTSTAKRLSKLDDSDSEIEITQNFNKRRRRDYKPEERNSRESKLPSRVVDVPREKSSKYTPKPKEDTPKTDGKSKVKTNEDLLKCNEGTSKSKEKGSDKKSNDKKDPFDELIRSSKIDKNKEKSRSDYTSRQSREPVKSKDDKAKKPSKTPSQEKSKSSEKSEKITKKDEEESSRKRDKSLEKVFKRPLKDEVRTDKRRSSIPRSPARDTKSPVTDVKSSKNDASGRKDKSTSRDARSSRNDKSSSRSPLRSLKRSRSETRSTRSPEREAKNRKVEVRSTKTPVKELKKSEIDTQSAKKVSKSDKSSTQSPAREIKSNKNETKDKPKRSYEEAEKDYRASGTRTRKDESGAKLSKTSEKDKQQMLTDEKKDDKLNAQIKSQQSKDEKSTAKTKDAVSKVEDNKVQQKSVTPKEQKSTKIEETQTQKIQKDKDDRVTKETATKTEEKKLQQQKPTKTSQDKDLVPVKSEDNKSQPIIIKEKGQSTSQDKASNDKVKVTKLLGKDQKALQDKGISDKSELPQKESQSQKIQKDEKVSKEPTNKAEEKKLQQRPSKELKTSQDKEIIVKSELQQIIIKDQNISQDKASSSNVKVTKLQQGKDQKASQDMGTSNDKAELPQKESKPQATEKSRRKGIIKHETVITTQDKESKNLLEQKSEKHKKPAIILVRPEEKKLQQRLTTGVVKPADSKVQDITVNPAKSEKNIKEDKSMKIPQESGSSLKPESDGKCKTTARILDPQLLTAITDTSSTEVYIILDDRPAASTNRKRKESVNDDSLIIENTPKKVKPDAATTRKRKCDQVVQETKKPCVVEEKKQLLTKPDADKQFCELEPLVTEIIAQNIEQGYNSILDNLNLVDPISGNVNVEIPPSNVTEVEMGPLNFFVTEEVQTSQNDSVPPAVELGQSEDDKAVENNLEGSAALLYANANHTVDQRHFENFYNDIMINQFTEFLEINDTVETGLAFDPVNTNTSSSVSTEYQIPITNNQFNSIYPGTPSNGYQTISINTELENQQQVDDHSYADVVETVENFHKSIRGSPIDAAISPQSSDASTIKSLVIDQENLEMQYTQFDAMYHENTSDCITVSAVPTTSSQQNHYQSIGVSSNNVQSELIDSEQSREPTLGSDHTTSTMDLLISGSLESETPEETETREIGESTIPFNISDNPLDGTLEPLDIFFMSSRKTYDAHLDDVSVGDILESQNDQLTPSTILDVETSKNNVPKQAECLPQPQLNLTPSPTPDVESQQNNVPKQAECLPQLNPTHDVEPPQSIVPNQVECLPQLNLTPDVEPPQNIVPKQAEGLPQLYPTPSPTPNVEPPQNIFPKRAEGLPQLNLTPDVESLQNIVPKQAEGLPQLNLTPDVEPPQNIVPKRAECLPQLYFTPSPTVDVGPPQNNVPKRAECLPQLNLTPDVEPPKNTVPKQAEALPQKVTPENVPPKNIVLKKPELQSSKVTSLPPQAPTQPQKVTPPTTPEPATVDILKIPKRSNQKRKVIPPPRKIILPARQSTPPTSTVTSDPSKQIRVIPMQQLLLPQSTTSEETPKSPSAHTSNLPTTSGNSPASATVGSRVNKPSMPVLVEHISYPINKNATAASQRSGPESLMRQGTRSSTKKMQEALKLREKVKPPVDPSEQCKNQPPYFVETPSSSSKKKQDLRKSKADELLEQVRREQEQAKREQEQAKREQEQAKREQEQAKREQEQQAIREQEQQARREQEQQARQEQEQQARREQELLLAAQIQQEAQQRQEQILIQQQLLIQQAQQQENFRKETEALILKREQNYRHHRLRKQEEVKRQLLRGIQQETPEQVRPRPEQLRRAQELNARRRREQEEAARQLELGRTNVGQESLWNPATAGPSTSRSRRGSNKSQSDPYEHGAFEDARRIQTYCAVDGRLPQTIVFPGQVRPSSELPNPILSRRTDPYTPHVQGLMVNLNNHLATHNLKTATTLGKTVKPDTTSAAKNIPLFPGPSEAGSSKTSNQEKKSPAAKKKEDSFEWGHQLLEILKGRDDGDSLRLPGATRNT